jgi:hypothetical protein
MSKAPIALPFFHDRQLANPVDTDTGERRRGFGDEQLSLLELPD